MRQVRLNYRSTKYIGRIEKKTCVKVQLNSLNHKKKKVVRPLLHLYAIGKERE